MYHPNLNNQSSVNIQQKIATKAQILCSMKQQMLFATAAGRDVKLMSPYLPSCDFRFQYVLSAPTSPATKMNEETLTYLNQGQPYELKIKKIGNAHQQGSKYYKVIILSL